MQEQTIGETNNNLIYKTMKDNFDLRQYLTENKMTACSRGRDRVHFGETMLNEHVVLEMNDTSDQGIDECDMTIDESVNREALYREFVGYASKYGENKAWKIMEKFYPDIDFAKLNIIPKFAKQNAKIGNAQDQARLNSVATYNIDELEDALDEVGYTDVDDEYVDDDDFIGARGSNADVGIETDKRAAAAAKKGMQGTDLDVNAPEEGPEFPDQPDDAEDTEDFQDPEDIDTPVSDETTPSTDVDPAKIFGKNAPYVEVLVDDLGQYLKGPKGRWRVNVSTNVLRRAVDSVMAYMQEYEFPRKGFLLAPNKAGHYDEIPVLGINTLNNTPKAVVYVHREPINDEA